MFKNCLLVASMMLAVLSGKAQILSNGDIYDVSVGDKFAYTDYIYRGTTGPPLYVFKKVMKCKFLVAIACTLPTMSVPMVMSIQVG